MINIKILAIGALSLFAIATLFAPLDKKMKGEILAGTGFLAALVILFTL